MRLMSEFQVLLYYKYVTVENPEYFRDEHRVLCEKLNLKGRIIVAQEGLNGTVEGRTEDTEEYARILKNDPRFADMDIKRSVGTGAAFPRLSVKARSEIVSMHLGEQDFSPTRVTGKYLKAEELHEWILSGKEFYIVDMRNDYEYKVGRFEGSLFPNLENFRDVPKVLPELESLKNKTVVTVCTGGVRCEKASGFLVQNGFNDVYQLYGGIVTYMEKYPNEHFKGSLYVFDKRIVMKFESDTVPHEIIGRCQKCDVPTDHYVNCQNLACHMHFLCCEKCLAEDGKAYCEKEVVTA